MPTASTRLRDVHELTSPYKSLHDNYVSNTRKSKCSSSALLATGGLIVLGVLLAIVVIEKLKNEDQINEDLSPHHHTPTCCNDTIPNEQSSIVLVESFPLGMDYGRNASAGKSLYEAWKHLLSLATKEIAVASFYWSLTAEDINVNSTTDRAGRDILEEFRALPSRNVSVRVVTSIPTVAHNSTDLQVLKENGIQIRRVNFGRLTKGILHTKFWIVDRKHIYIGSANMDWRALTQVKELGVVIYNSSGLAADLHKIFQSYWVMGRSNASIPDPWPSTYDTFINEERPLLLNLSGVASQVYITVISLPYIIMDHKNKFIYGILEMPINLKRQRNKRQCFSSSSVYFYGIAGEQKRLLCKTSFISRLPQASPPAFCPDSRTQDLDAILSAIRGAQDFIHVSVMEYYPASKFFHHHGYWPVIEDALKRSAFERNVSVCLLVSCGQETDPSIWPFLRSLDALHSPSNNINIAVRLFIIPAGNQSHIPYTRVNHNKYMVTDKVAYVGTSNWSADYFNSTAGVGLVVSQDALPSVSPGNTFQQQLTAVFDRDWNSQFAVPLAELKQNHDCVFSKSTP